MMWAQGRCDTPMLGIDAVDQDTLLLTEPCHHTHVSDAVPSPHSAPSSLLSRKAQVWPGDGDSSMPGFLPWWLFADQLP